MQLFVAKLAAKRLNLFKTYLKADIGVYLVILLYFAQPFDGTRHTKIVSGLVMLENQKQKIL